MAITRVTQQLLVDRVLSNLRNQVKSVLDVQEALSTGRRINAPSDDPIDARRSINTRTIIQKTTQYIDNMAMTRPQHTETTDIIDNIQDIVARARELTLRGANSTNAQTQLDIISDEVNQLIEATVDNANHVSNGRYIFAGSRTLTPAYSATRDANDEIVGVTYDGNTDRIKVAVSDTMEIVLNEPGSEVFQSNVDLFQVLIGIRDDLRAGDTGNLSAVRLQELDDAQEQLSRATARVGAAQNRVDRAENEAEDFRFQNESLLSSIIDADFAETVLELNVQQNAYQAALNAAGRVLLPSLLDFIQ